MQCNSCDEFISEEDEYCPCCGDKLTEEIFKERGLTDLAVFCEEAIEAMGINPVLARVGYEGWKFYKGSSEIRMFVYDRSYLFATSPLEYSAKEEPGTCADLFTSDRDCSFIVSDWMEIRFIFLIVCIFLIYSQIIRKMLRRI